MPEALTFRHIFGRGTLLSGETGEFEDLTPLSNTGTSVTTTSVSANAAYTNGKYTITDPNGLKQKVKKFNAATSPNPPNNVATQYTNWGVKVVSMSASITSLKVIWKHVRAPCANPLTRCCFLLSAVLTFSPAAQPAVTQSDRKLASEQILRQLLTSLNASSTSRPQIDVVSLLPSLLFSLGFGSARLRHLSLTRLQGVSSLSLNSGSINLAFSTTKSLSQRQSVVSNIAEGPSGKLVSYTLPYLFQSIDTTTGSKALPVCETALVSALQYTDIGGKSGTHPDFPPFPLCRSKTGTKANDFKAIAPNPAQASDGYRFPKSTNGWELAGWVSGGPGVTSDWTATITVPTSTLVKTVSSGSLCRPPPPSVPALLLSSPPCLQRCLFCIPFHPKRTVTFRVQIR